MLKSPMTTYFPRPTIPSIHLHSSSLSLLLFGAYMLMNVIRSSATLVLIHKRLSSHLFPSLLSAN
eukprot:c16449_g1_i1 orf=3-194(-)